MKNMEITIRESFRRVKDDILDLQRQISELNAENERLAKELAKKQDRVISAQIKQLKQIAEKKEVKKTPAKKKSKRYVVSKTGNKFHIEDCPYAQNIKPKSKIFFQSKTKPLNEGYKKCTCVK